MNERFDRIKQQQASMSPMLSSRRTITPRREQERPNTSNIMKARKFDKNLDSNVPVFEASLFKSMEINLQSQKAISKSTLRTTQL